MRRIGWLGVAALLLVGAGWAQRRFQPMKWETVQGWGALQAALADGKGDDFIQKLAGLGVGDFTGRDEQEAMLTAARWVARHTQPRRIPTPPGIACGSAKAMYDEMMTSVMLQGNAPADSLQQAILLASMLRFHTYRGIPPERVFVFAAVRSEGEAPPQLFRAWIVYKDQVAGKWWYLATAQGQNAYSDQPPKELSEEPPELPEGSTYVLFNDRMVKGKGPLWEELEETEDAG